MKEIFIQNHEIPIRLDKFIKKQYNSPPQSLIEKELRLKRIRLNKARAKSKDKVCSGDILQIQNQTIAKLEDCHNISQASNHLLSNKQGTANGSNDTDKAPKQLAEKLKKHILYEDSGLLVLDKPENMAVQGGNKVFVSIDSALKYMSDELKEARLVHRLDKNTSGILLIAKSYDMAVRLTGAFKARSISKYYKAILAGKPNYKQLICLQDYRGNIKILPLTSESRDLESDGSYKSKLENLHIKEDDYQAITLGYTEALSGDFSYMKLRPVTGTKHQLRRHAPYIAGHIVGDEKYGRRLEGRNWQNKYLCLHAAKLCLSKEFIDEEFSNSNSRNSADKICLESPLPSKFKDRLDYFGLR
jgi:23S rRNA pseudouridine955/2504/2580 synthase